MKIQFIKLAVLLVLSQGAFSCKKEYDDKSLAPTEDRIPDIPVRVTNASFFELYPVVTTSLASGGAITINFEIPADKGRIKEITRVTTGTTVGVPNLQTQSAATAINASGTPRAVQAIPGNGTNTITYSSDLNVYLLYRRAIGANAGPAGPVPAAPAPQVVSLPVPSVTATPTEITYNSLITLEDNTTIIPLPVRVRVIP